MLRQFRMDWICRVYYFTTSSHAGGGWQSSLLSLGAVLLVDARGKKRGWTRAGGDVEEREKYGMVVNGYCG